MLLPSPLAILVTPFLILHPHRGRVRGAHTSIPWKGDDMATGKGPAHNAGKLLGNKNTSKPVKKVAASDLSQVKKHPPKKK